MIVMMEAKEDKYEDFSLASGRIVVLLEEIRTVMKEETL